MRNTTDQNLIGLPAFTVNPPTKLNWGYNPGTRNPEVQLVQKRVAELKGEGLTGDSMVATFISRRVLPLQRRVHKICHMSGRLDPTRTSTFQLDQIQIWQRSKAIAKVDMTSTWEWVLRPYSRRRLPPAVSYYSFTDITLVSVFVLGSDPLLLAQIFDRQRIEDGPDPASKCAPDRATYDLEDPDNEDYVPIPLVIASTPPGKTRARGSIRDWPDEDSDDCVLLEVLNPPSISLDRKSTRLNSSHITRSRMPSSA